MAIINNFRKMNSSYDEKPPHLSEFGKHEEFLIFSSSFNPILYVIYNPNDKTYYAFENQGSEDILNDLQKNIEAYFRKFT